MGQLTFGSSPNPYIMCCTERKRIEVSHMYGENINRKEQTIQKTEEGLTVLLEDAALALKARCGCLSAAGDVVVVRGGGGLA